MIDETILRALWLAARINPYGCIENARARDAAQSALQAIESEQGEVRDMLTQVVAAPEPDSAYNSARLAWELECIALGEGYFPNALRIAMGIPGISQAEKDALERYARGTQYKTDHIELQDLAVRLYLEGDQMLRPTVESRPSERA